MAASRRCLPKLKFVVLLHSRSGFGRLGDGWAASWPLQNSWQSVWSMDLRESTLQFCSAIRTFTIVCADQIDLAMDGLVVTCQTAPGPDRPCDGWLDGHLPSSAWTRLAVRWMAGGRLPSGALTLSLHIVKVSWGTLGSQQALLTCTRVFGAFALVFGLWPAGRWMGERLGPCKILGNLCDLWICVRIRCSFVV